MSLVQSPALSGLYTWSSPSPGSECVIEVYADECAQQAPAVSGPDERLVNATTCLEGDC